MSDLFVGIDAGSTTTKVAIVEGGKVLAREISATGANCRQTARALFEKALASCGRAESDVAGVVSTGYGRRLVDLGGEAVSEITCNAAGAVFLAGGSPEGRVRTIVDIGGQDSKVISLDESGRVADFAMNDKCAAGTGRFLEVMSRILEVDLDRLGEIALKSNEPLPIASLCTVFAESEVVSLVSQGKPVPDIVAGIHEATAARVGTLVRRVGLRTPVFFDGGPALNAGMRKALERNLGVELIVPAHPQFVTATGAALTACERHPAT
jgi:predicted CoA-substrate-specific enzyme activase